MAEPTSDNKITLNVLIEDDDVHEQMFNVTVSLQGIFYDIHPTIQEVYWKRQQISIYGLRLYLGNAPFEQVGNFQLSDEAYLSGVRSVESVWPSGSDVDKRLVHIIVRPRSKQVTKTQRTTTPPTAKSDFDQFIEEFSNTQLNFIRAIRKTTSSTAAAPKNFRAQQSGPDYINIGRPAEKAWFPIVLHHPVFGRFLARLQSTDPIDPKVYQHTSNYFYLSQNLYAEENNNSNARDETIRSSLERLLGGTLVKNSADGVQADGVLAGPEATYIQIMEMKNEIGTGSSDPSIQAAQSYSRYWGNKATFIFTYDAICSFKLSILLNPESMSTVQM
ncbi:unnamed protein product [Rhizoctonia solani]|uniref:Uncharacterized protein n=1 Tax=Rhizoctonia solani TaxID=456999 RepID=A0A8H3HEJ6_9AGAM|nr:unnamed protein product [Rhizoctonia solani]